MLVVPWKFSDYGLTKPHIGMMPSSSKLDFSTDAVPCALANSKAMEAAVNTMANALKAVLGPFEKQLKVVTEESKELQRRVLRLEAENKTLKEDNMEVEKLLSEDNAGVLCISCLRHKFARTSME